jgi:hypothetical protein
MSYIRKVQLYVTNSEALQHQLAFSDLINAGCINKIIPMRHLIVVAITTSTLALSTLGAIAQASDIPIPTNTGDFTSAFVKGNRGYYNVEKWLVVESYDPADMLNCRATPNGKVRSQIEPGAIVTAVFKGPANERGRMTPNPANDAIVMSDGSPWLRIRGTRDELAYPVPRTDFSALGECYVRANLKYIAPINNDSLPGLSR